MCCTKVCQYIARVHLPPHAITYALPGISCISCNDITYSTARAVPGSASMWHGSTRPLRPSPVRRWTSWRIFTNMFLDMLFACCSRISQQVAREHLPPRAIASALPDFLMHHLYAARKEGPEPLAEFLAHLRLDPDQVGGHAQTPA